MSIDKPCKYQFTFMIEPKVKDQGWGWDRMKKRSCAYERALRAQAMKQVQCDMDLPLVDRPLSVLFKFFLPHQKKPESSLQFKRPDASNLIKAAEDALNGVIWKDDGMIQSVTGEKYYSKAPRIELFVWLL